MNLTNALASIILFKCIHKSACCRPGECDGKVLESNLRGIVLKCLSLVAGAEFTRESQFEEEVCKLSGLSASNNYRQVLALYRKLGRLSRLTAGCNSHSMMSSGALPSAHMRR